LSYSEPDQEPPIVMVSEPAFSLGVIEDETAGEDETVGENFKNKNTLIQLGQLAGFI